MAIAISPLIVLLKEFETSDPNEFQKKMVESLIKYYKGPNKDYNELYALKDNMLYFQGYFLNALSEAHHNISMEKVKADFIWGQKSWSIVEFAELKGCSDKNVYGRISEEGKMGKLLARRNPATGELRIYEVDYEEWKEATGKDFRKGVFPKKPRKGKSNSK